MRVNEKTLKAWGYYLESEYVTRSDAEGAADDISRCGEGQVTHVRYSRNNSAWQLWVESEKHHEERALAAS